MTSKERLTRLINGQMTDRVPINLYEIQPFAKDGFYHRNPSYNNLLRLGRQKTDCIIMSGPRSNSTFFGSAYPLDIEQSHTKEGIYTVQTTIYKTPKGDLREVKKWTENLDTVWVVEHMCKSNEDVQKILSVPYVEPKYDASVVNQEENDLGDNGIVMGGMPDAAFAVMDSFEFGAGSVYVLTETADYIKAFEELHERFINNIRLELKEKALPLYRQCGSEYFTPPYLPPYIFEKVQKKVIRDTADIIHEYDSKLRVHCHGNIAKVIDMMLEYGADALDPCEPPPDGDIELKALKAKVKGTKVALFGNLELHLLEHGTKQDVIDTVKHNIDVACENGGYCIMPTAAPINAELSKQTEENYFAFVETAYNYGKY